MEILILAILIPSYSSASCFNSILVEEHTKEFIASIPFPKIIENKKIKNIKIKCDLYKKVTIGDILSTEDIKEFVFLENNPEISPHGKIKKISYRILKK